MASTYRIGQAASLIGVSTSSLKRLEIEGKIPLAERDWSGARRYSPEQIEAIRDLLFSKDVSEAAT